MSVQELGAIAQKFCDAFSRMDMKAGLDLFADDVEIFDHVPYRFDNKQQFADFLVGAMAGIASGNTGFRQLSCRVFNENTGVINAYDTFTGATKDGKALNIHGRTTLVCAKQGGQWKIVSAHFSPLPHA
jgi:uncharacterized protein (TIGR02246 family)